MSRQGRRGPKYALVLLCAAVAWPSVVAAAPQSDEELLRRIEELRPRLEQARLQLDSAKRRRALSAAAEPHDETVTIRVGPIRIVTTPRQAALARTLFDEVWRRDFGSVSESPSIARHVFTFRWLRMAGPDLYVDLEAVGGATVRRVELNRFWVPTWAGAEARIRDALWAVLREDLPDGSPIRGWLGDAPYVASSLTYRLLAGTSAQANRSCLEGDAVACSATVGLGLRAPGPSATDPYARRARVDLLWHAVARGGDGAWRRALDTAHGGSPAEVLTRASGHPLDELTGSWRDELAAQAPTAYAGLGSTGWGVLFWFVVFAVLATRSKRWRLG